MISEEILYKRFKVKNTITDGDDLFISFKPDLIFLNVIEETKDYVRMSPCKYVEKNNKLYLTNNNEKNEYTWMITDDNGKFTLWLFYDGKPKAFPMTLNASIYQSYI